MSKEKISITIEGRVLEKLESEIDGIKAKNRSQAIENILKKHLGTEKTAVILAGGNPEDLFIDDLDNYRPLVEVDGKTLIEDTVEKLRGQDFTDIYIVARKELLSEIMNRLGDGSEYRINLNYVEDRYAGKEKGTLSSLKSLKNEINKTFLLVPGDNYLDLDLEKFWKTHLGNRGTVTLALTTSSDSDRLSVVSAEGNEIKEFCSSGSEGGDSDLVWTGIFIANPEFLDLEGTTIESDVLPDLYEENELYGYLFTGDWVNVHSKEDLERISVSEQ